jgi:hypothetical protein
VGPAGPAGSAATALWAVVNTSGSIARSSSTTSAGHLGVGDYEVIFNKDVTKCAYSATTGTPTTGTTGRVFASVGSRAGDTAGVEVTTFNADGTAIDAPFHLEVFC